MPRIAKAFLYLVYLVIVGGLVAAIGLTFHHDHVSAPGAPKTSHKTVAQAKPKKAASTPKTSTKAPTKSSKSSSSSKSATKSSNSASQPSPKTQSTATSTQLSNTGPGDVVRLFAVVSLAGAVTYRRRLVRRLHY